MKKKDEVKQAEDLSSEELGLMKDPLFDTIIQAQNQLRVINAELTKRKEPNGGK